MKRTDLTRALIETAVRRSLNAIQESPEREIRNLVDLGVNFSNGRFQKHFLKTAQNMLENTRSAYYTLVKDTVLYVERERLITFGLNLGYDSCTKGAKTIREIEAARHFNIPWALNLAVNEVRLRETPAFYPSLLEQAAALGISACFLFAGGGDPLRLASLLKTQPSGAFMLFLHSRDITGTFLSAFADVKNVLISVQTDSGTPEACRKLRDAGFLYAVHSWYHETDEARILSGAWLKEMLCLLSPFAFLLAEPSCKKTVQQKIYAYVLSIRDSQRYPLLVMDLRQDMLMIDRVISDDICMAGFDPDGNLWTHQGPVPGKRFNIFENRLEEILKTAMAK